MVVNVNNKDGKIKMVSFMRDTLVHIDGVSQQTDPDYSDYYDQKLNTAFTIGEQNNNQGAELVRQMLKDNFDIDIQYYAMVDFQTFATAIDTLFPNGVEMNAQFSTIDGETVSEVEVPDDLNMKDGVVPNQPLRSENNGWMAGPSSTMLVSVKMMRETLDGRDANKKSCLPLFTKSRIQLNSSLVLKH